MDYSSDKTAGKQEHSDAVCLAEDRSKSLEESLTTQSDKHPGCSQEKVIRDLFPWYC